MTMFLRELYMLIRLRESLTGSPVTRYLKNMRAGRISQSWDAHLLLLIILMRSTGNVALKEFSSVVERVSAYYGFVGRNNGNEFLVVIDNCTGDKMDRFMGELQKEIDIYNKTSGGYAIRIKQSKVLNEVLGLDDFRELVAKLYGIAKV